MAIVLRHFDVLTGQWITVPNADPVTRQQQPEVYLEEALNDTLLESFVSKQFPELPLDATFSVAKISTKNDPQDLLDNSHPHRHVLLLTNGERAIYGPPEVRDYIHSEINPDPLHNGAYGSLFVGDCKHSYQGKATYLVVDDKTGENGGILPNDLAYKLVGDSHGKVAAQFAKEKWSDTYSHLLQFRLGDLSEDVYAKGVLAPKRLEQYFGDNPLGQKVDFILPTSSFKGKGKLTVKPGLYEDRQIWIGEKDRSKAGSIRGSQLLEDHPTALWDLFPQMEVGRE